MTTRLSQGAIVKLVALAAVTILIVWIARNSYWTEVTVPKPLSGEAATNPFYTAQHLVDKLGAHSEWRHVLGALPPSNAVIVLSNWDWSVIPTRRELLEQWVAAGGRLVLDDSLLGGDERLKSWSGIGRVVRKRAVQRNSKSEDDGDKDSEADDGSLTERLERMAAGDCAEVTHTRAPAMTGEPDAYRLCNINSREQLTSDRLVSWALHDERGLQAVRVNIGFGSVTKLNAAPFGNRQLFNGDHALLFVAATQLKRGDAIYFLSEEERESLLALTWHYGAPVVVLALAAIVLALWRNSLRFGPLAAEADSARRSLTEQICGTGQFTLQFGGGRALHAAAVRALHEAAAEHLVRYARLPSEERIAVLAQSIGLDAAALTEAINYAGPRRAAELRGVIALLERARRRVLHTKRLQR